MPFYRQAELQNGPNVLDKFANPVGGHRNIEYYNAVLHLKAAAPSSHMARGLALQLTVLRIAALRPILQPQCLYL